ncbi:beta-lactamase-like protein [Trichoderma novae-zelandiae]
MDLALEPYDDNVSSSWLICSTCGTQFPTADRSALRTCHVCDDPRQYVPPSGQSFTTMADIRASGHRNEMKPYEHDERVISIHTEPRFAIGQRAILIRTPEGNILWDCITLLDDETVDKIKQLGGLKAIVISHPHFYSTHIQWARAFQCPVYVSAEDVRWTTTPSAHRKPITDVESEIVPGVQAIKLGGHFPGSMVLLFDGRLFIADTLMTTPAGIGKWEVDALGQKREKPPGLNSFSFQWSFPNNIPLSADEIHRMWGILKAYSFRSTHGILVGMDIEDDEVKARVLESMKIQTRAMGNVTHALLDETL